MVHRQSHVSEHNVNVHLQRVQELVVTTGDGREGVLYTFRNERVLQANFIRLVRRNKTRDVLNNDVQEALRGILYG
jgi:hypothetical protein